MVSWITVHNGGTYRIKVAEEQQQKMKEYLKDQNLTKDKFKQRVIEYTIESLDIFGIDLDTTNKYLSCSINKCVQNRINIDYKNIQKEFGLADVRDIVWMKFTSSGALGVVASSNDINFQKPSSIKEYDEKQQNGKWKYNTSGIIIDRLGEKWDESFVLIFPIKSIPRSMTRHGVEKKIGNYLIDKGIPILDYYSHRIGGK
ncbi:hypothetical protein [Streptococcus mitis]|jgi:hypothetical protein|uniref:hypothetical protein n=1 Tax=Streptococcus mitis TaxID=28037 RepID=UPI0021B7C3F7|nr:hypothetical protein [Streptococcus mitis]